MSTFEARLEKFIAGVEKLHDDAKVGDYYRPITTVPGPKYVKVVHGSSVYCFIDRSNGDVLKAASWSRPAKHPRGNIFDESNGLSRCQWTGPEYLK